MPEQDEIAEEVVWVFNGGGATFPSGVFRTRARAEEWILRNRLDGTLTAYPLDTGIHDWALAKGYFKPSRPDQGGPKFIGRFSSAYLEHYHFRGDEDTEETI